MDCKKMEWKLYVYAELTEQEKREVEEHLKGCASCQKVWSAIADTQQKIQAAATVKVYPENAARLTHRIMSEIQQPASAYSGMSMVDRLLRKVVVKYSFAGLSLGLILLFVTEFYQEPHQPLNDRVVTAAATVPLRSMEFKQTYARMRDKYAACGSPFKSALTYRDCLIDKFK